MQCVNSPPPKQQVCFLTQNIPVTPLWCHPTDATHPQRVPLFPCMPDIGWERPCWCFRRILRGLLQNKFFLKNSRKLSSGSVCFPWHTPHAETEPRCAVLAHRMNNPCAHARACLWGERNPLSALFLSGISGSLSQSVRHNQPQAWVEFVPVVSELLFCLGGLELLLQQRIREFG